MLLQFEDFLTDISRCFIERDLELWMSRLILPFSFVTRDGLTTLSTEEEVARSFGLYQRALDIMALDIIDRSIVSLEDCKDGTWLGTFQTRLVSRGELATAPYTSTALLQPRDGRFLMSSMLNARGHVEWTGETDL